MLSPLDLGGNRERRMATIRPARGQTLVRYLAVPRAIVESSETTLVPGVPTISGHGVIVLSLRGA